MAETRAFLSIEKCQFKCLISSRELLKEKLKKTKFKRYYQKERKITISRLYTNVKLSIS